MTAYEELERRFRRLSALGQALGMLHWDMAVMMPPGGAETRSAQLTALKLTRHELLTAPQVAEWLDAAESEPLDDPWKAANLREMRRAWIHASVVAPDLLEALSTASTACQMVWREARPANDFARVAPHLEEVLSLAREVAAAKAAALSCSPYEALMDQYEPGVRARDVDALFADLSDFLPDLIETALARQAARPAPLVPEGPFPVEAQRRVATRLMEALGFDFGRGRLDVSLHPFCGGAPGDHRITTRYDENDFAQCLMSVLHETGHALYEMGLPEDWRHQPVGRARGMAMHESQSLLVEMQACRSREFLEFAAPLMREAFGAEGPAWSPDNLHRLHTRVERGLIRVDADEATYPAHVVLRYRLERAMISDDLAIRDLPGAWTEGMEELLQIVPPDDKDGCLQDIHWFDGAFGYFPTYTLGALAAAQLYEAARRARPEIPQAIAGGDFAPLLSWLRDNVHRHGSRETTEEILIRATGQPLGTRTFKRHLEARYAS